MLIEGALLRSSQANFFSQKEMKINVFPSKEEECSQTANSNQLTNNGTGCDCPSIETRETNDILK